MKTRFFSPRLPLLAAMLTACAGPTPRGPSSDVEVAKLGPLVRSNNYSAKFCPHALPKYPCYMKQRDAETYCREQLDHLPTARDFAAYVQAYGGRGVQEIKVEGEPPPAEDFYRVNTLNPGNVRDDFFFSQDGYDAERGSLGRHLYWTASEIPGQGYDAQVFSGETGGVVGESRERRRDKLHAVR